MNGIKINSIKKVNGILKVVKDSKVKDTKIKLTKVSNIFGSKKGWCFTCYDLNKYDEWKTMELKSIVYMCYQEECCPSTGKLHLQGYLEYKNETTMMKIKKCLNSNEVHLEPRKGTKLEAKNYCCKSETKTKEFVELGDNTIFESTQGTRNDIKDLYELIKDGKTDYELQEFNPSAYGKYYKGLERMRNNLLSKDCGKFENINVNIIYGKAGCGKTSYIYEKHGQDNCFKLEKGNGDNIWFDGYKGEKVLIIDDFYGWIKYSKMLNFLDGYKMRLEIKGGVTYSNWNHIYITSNESPDKWYKQGLTPALKRRINTVFNMKEIGKLFVETKKFEIKPKVEIKIQFEIIDEDDTEVVKTDTKNLEFSVKLPGNTIDKSITGKSKDQASKESKEKIIKKNTKVKDTKVINDIGDNICINCNASLFCGCTWKPYDINDID